jgi:DNA-3-methyladenine glycosylase II
VLLPIPEPYDFELSTSRFRDFGSDGATVWHEGGLHRVVAGAEVRIEPAAGGVRVEPGSDEALREAGLLLGLPFDLGAFGSWAAGQPVVDRLAIRLRGLRPPLNPRPFEALVLAITSQQISLRAAAAIRGRFVAAFGDRHEHAWEFPDRERIALLRPRALTVLGFSTRKAEYVLALARSDLDLDALDALTDEEVVAALTALPGLGRWTADWFLARHLARPQAWPAGDLGVRKAVGAFYADGRLPTIEEVRAMGERFAPFQNLAAHYLLFGARLAG